MSISVTCKKSLYFVAHFIFEPGAFIPTLSIKKKNLPVNLPVISFGTLAIHRYSGNHFLFQMAIIFSSMMTVTIIQKQYFIKNYDPSFGHNVLNTFFALYTCTSATKISMTSIRLYTDFN